jgi:hypothetical protein
MNVQSCFPTTKYQSFHPMDTEEAHTMIGKKAVSVWQDGIFDNVKKRKRQRTDNSRQNTPLEHATV